MTRSQLEALLVSKRRERELYVSAEGVTRIHAEIDRLLTEWEQAAPESVPA